jgi:flagellar export protein FliJ
VKAFHFRLDQALRWRETQASLQKSRVAAAVGRLAEIDRALENERASLTAASSGIVDNPAGHSLQSFAAFRDRTRARIRDLEGQSLVARRNVGLEMTSLIEATRKVRVLENLKQADQTRWRQDLDRELAAFADEAFLSRLQLK